jgi:glycerol-3-phosphate O-acyltransferase
MLRGFESGEGRDIVFIPVGVNYDRVLEDRTLLLDKRPGARKSSGHATWTTTRFVLRNLRLMVSGGWQRFGYAAMCFGAPLSLRAYLVRRNLDLRSLTGEDRNEQVRALAQNLMGEVGRLIPVLPVSLLATVFVGHPGVWLTETEIMEKAVAMMDELERNGACVYVPRKGTEAAVQSGLRRLLLRRFVECAAGRYRVLSGQRPILDYYANAISHLFLPSGSEDSTHP